MPVSIGAPKKTLSPKKPVSPPQEEQVEVGSLTSSGTEKPAKKAPSKPSAPPTLKNPFHKGDQWRQMADAPQDGTAIHAAVRWPQAGVQFYDVQWVKPDGHQEHGWYVVGRAWMRLSDHMMLGWMDAVGVPKWTSAT